MNLDDKTNLFPQSNAFQSQHFNQESIYTTSHNMNFGQFDVYMKKDQEAIRVKNMQKIY